LKHRHTLVQMHTRVKNQWQHIALNQGMQKKVSCGRGPGKNCCGDWSYLPPPSSF